MSVLLLIAAVISMLAVLVILGAGVIVMARGGEVATKWSNRLMRWRILAQAIALGLIVIFVISLQKS